MATLVSGSMVTDGSINAADIAAGAIPTKLGSEIGSFGFRNRLINGDFKFDERAGGALVTYTGTAATSDLYRTADRWAIFGAGNQTQAQRITDTNTVSFPTAMRIRRVNGTSQVTALYLGQVIERANCTGLAGGPITLSFVARRGSTYSGTNNTIEAEIWTGTNTDDRTWWQLTNSQWENQARPLVQIPTLTTSWQTFSYTVTLPSNVQQIMIRFAATQAGTSNPDDYVDIAQVQLEKGSIRTPFEERPVGLEYSLCKRYYHRETWTVDDSNLAIVCNGYMVIPQQWEGMYQFPAPMRIPPTSFTYSSLTHFSIRANPVINLTNLLYYKPTTLSTLIFTGNPDVGYSGYGTSLCTKNNLNGSFWIAFDAEL